MSPTLRATFLLAAFVAHEACSVERADASPPSTLPDSRAARPDFDRLLPASTVEFVLVPSVQRLESHGSQTQYAQFLTDTALAAYMAEERPGLFRAAALPTALGLGLAELSSIAGGPAAWAVVRPTPSRSAHVLLVDVRGRPSELITLLTKVVTRLRALGGAVRAHKTDGLSVTAFELPDPTNRPSRLKGFYFVKEEVLIAADELDVAVEIGRRWGAAGRDNLAGNPAYQAICAASAPPTGEAAAQLSWFVDPIGRAEAARAATPWPKEKGPDPLHLAERQGLGGIRAIGGGVSINLGPYDVYQRTAVYAPPPRRKSLRMVRFVGGTDLSPEPWVPADTSLYLTSSLDVGNLFDSLDPLFDMFAGSPGMFRKVLRDLKDDPDGPRVDVRRQIVGALGNRVSVVGDGERLLVALPIVKDEAVLVAALRRALGPDVHCKAGVVRGYRVWEMPHLAVCVADGSLFLTDRVDYLQAVLAKKSAKAELVRQSEYERVRLELGTSGAGKPAGMLFLRQAEDFSPTYELLRAGGLDRAKTLYARWLLRRLLPSDPKRWLAGEKLPPYARVRQHLQPAGVCLYNRPDGWLLVGGVLKKPATTPPARSTAKKP